MLKFNEQKQIESVNGALALRNQINELIDGICKEGYKNICWLGIGGTYASCLQAEVHMKEKSKLSFFVENAAEYLTTGNKKVGEGTIVIISSVTGTTSEIVDGVKKAQKSGARVIGFIDVATAELAKLVDYVITYPANEQLKFYMVADRFMYNAGEFPEYEDLYKELDQYLATALVEVEKEADAFGEEFATMYSVSRYLIHDIFDELISQHYLIRVHGKGTFVRKPEQNRVALGVLNESKNASFTSLVRNFGIEISNKCLGTGIIKNRKYFADKLGLSEEDEIYGIHRIRLGNKEPLAIEFTYVPLHFFSDIDNYNFEHISLYDYMKSKNHLPVKFNETMMMVEAGEKLQKHLHLPSATSIVNYIEFIGYDENGNLVEYTESYSRPDKLEVRFVTNDI